MDALKLTFKNGETLEFPFNADSTVAVTTPDGPNGTQHGAWGEVADVEYVKDGGDPVEEAPVDLAATPAAVALADEHGVDLAAVEGTGADGKVTKTDVAAAVTPEA